MHHDHRIASAFRATLYVSAAVLALLCALLFAHHGAPPQLPQPPQLAADEFGWPI